jgi:hypothetical protein
MKDITGSIFGELTCIKPDGKDSRGRYFWISKCSCGNLHRCLGSSLLKGSTLRCKECSLKHRKEMLIVRNKKRSISVGDITLAWWGSHIKKRAKGGNTKGFGSLGKSKQIELDIDMKYAWDLFLNQNKKCALSGLALKFPEGSKPYSKESTASLDRIDSSKGYIKGNVEFVCQGINFAKHDYSKEEVLQFINKIKNTTS